MFVDYYGILEVSQNATQDEIKFAFRNQALKWHPDKNPNVDTTIRMQQINEAYLILKDTDARARYDIEYKFFNEYQKQREQRVHEQEEKKAEKQGATNQYEYADYTINDDVLKRWVENARRQAVDLAKQTIEDFKGISISGAKAVASATVAGIIRYLFFGLIMIIILAIARSC